MLAVECRPPSGGLRRPGFDPTSGVSWSSSPTESSSAIRSARVDLRLEVLGKDLVAVQRGDEAIDLVLHVGPDQNVQVVEHRLGAVIEGLVEPIDGVLVVATAAVPLALGTPQRDVPLALACGCPIGGIDEVRAALGTDVKFTPAPPLRRRPDARLENARLEAALQVTPLGCIPVSHFDWSIGWTTQML